MDEIKTYIRMGGGEYEDWFIGLADNPMDPINEALLFHRIQSHLFLYIETVSTQLATNVVNYFIITLGTDGFISKQRIQKGYKALYVYKKAVNLIGKKDMNFNLVDLLRGVECRCGSAPSVISKKYRSSYA